MLILGFLAKRLAAIAASLLGVSFLVFAMLYLSPGSVLTTLLGPRPATPAEIAAVKAQYHLNDPFLVQYWHWLSGVLHGDFGQSVQTGQAVSGIVGPAALISLQLALYALVLVAAFGIPLGLVAGMRRAGKFDRISSVAAIVGMSAPPFSVGLVLVYVVGIKLQWFPVYGAGSGFVGRIEHLTLPAVTLAVGLMALLMRQTRASVMGVASEDYVTFAHVRGLRASRINTRYVLRNAAPGVITASGLLLILALSAAVLVETVFSIPGAGSLLVKSVNDKDIPLVQCVSLFLAALILLVSLLVDLVALVVDPRLRYDVAGA